MDPRWKDLAKQLAAGVNLQPGDKVSIFSTANSIYDAVAAFVEEVYAQGGYPQVILSDELFDRAALEHASEEFLALPAPMEAASMEWANVHVSFRGMVTPPEEQTDAQRLALQRKGKGVISTMRWQNTRWALVRVPTQEWADLISVDYDQLLTEFFEGCVADWDTIRQPWDKLARLMEEVGEMRIVTNDTDLTFNNRGRTWVTFAGGANFPDGEIATAPVETEVEGYITFPELFWFAGTRIKNLRLEFTNGAVSSISADEGQDLVEKLVATDAGSKYIGEVAIGTNAAIQTFTGDLLFDEKILGTVHFALGRAYPECGGVNESSLHWDIVKDLRREDGYLYAGDLVLIEKGKPTNILLTGER